MKRLTDFELKDIVGGVSVQGTDAIFQHANPEAVRALGLLPVDPPGGIHAIDAGPIVAQPIGTSTLSATAVAI